MDEHGRATCPILTIAFGSKLSQDVRFILLKVLADIATLTDAGGRGGSRFRIPSRTGLRFTRSLLRRHKRLKLGQFC